MTYAPGDEIAGGGPKVFGLPIDRDLMFTNHRGIFKPRIEKRQRKLIVKLAFLRPFLRRGEKLLLVTPCYSPLGSPGMYLTGFVFVYLKRSLLVFTNMRIFHVPTDPGYNYRQSLAEIDYEGCGAIELRRGVLSVLYARFNKLERFRKIAVSERRKLRALLASRIRPKGLKSELSGRRHLCPGCTHPLTRGKFKCSRCGLKFKSNIKAYLMAILVPGGGYLYTRHFLLGLLAAAVEIFLLVFFAVALRDALKGLTGSVAYAAVVGAIYLLIKIISVIHSTEFISEFVPAAKNVQLRLR